MAARLSNYPSYAIFDRTYEATISYSVANTPVITGTTNLMIDKDVATVLTVKDNSAGSTAQITMDFGRSLWNCIIYSKYDLGAGDTVSFRHSLNNTDWTNLDTTQHSITANYSVFNMRYLQWYATKAGSYSEVSVYEVKVMGSS